MPPWLHRLLNREKKREPVCTVVVPAAGQAVRMEGVDKILAPLADIPVLVHTLRALSDSHRVHEIIVVTRQELIVPVGQLCRDWGLGKVSKVLAGGARRIDSVRTGVLEARQDADLIAIHDGARPFLSRRVLEEVLTRAAHTGAAAPAIAPVDTIKRGRDGLIAETLAREDLWCVQTPQVFEASLIKAALAKAVEDGVEPTDDCATVERLGMKISLTEGDRRNIKITTPLDLWIGEALLAEGGD